MIQVFQDKPIFRQLLPHPLNHYLIAYITKPASSSIRNYALPFGRVNRQVHPRCLPLQRSVSFLHCPTITADEIIILHKAMEHVRPCNDSAIPLHKSDLLITPSSVS